MGIGLVLACMSLLAVHSASGQLRVRTTDLNYRVGQEGSIFLDVDHAEPFTHAEVALPAGWKLKDASLIQNGREIACSWSLEAGSSVYRIRSEEPASRGFRFAITVVAPTYATGGPLTVTPLDIVDGTVARRRSADAARADVVAEPAHFDKSRMAGSFGGMDRLRLKLDQLSMFEGESSYTAELRFKTTARDQVILSTWTGREEDAYPIELVLSAGGDLRFYRGRPGEHLSMSGSAPVADGRWHHVAIVYDDIRGWSRLLIDGAPADSLYGSVGSAFSATTDVFCVGGRCPADEEELSRATGFRGFIDDFRVWPVARTARQIKSALGESLSSVAGMIAVGFDDAVRDDLLVGRDRIERTLSDFLFFDPVRSLEAQAGEESVVISWQADTRNTSAFLVERSVDGADFREIGRVDPSESRGTGRHEFVDESAPERVVYYRVQQELNGIVKRPSGMLKVGLGKPEVPDLDRPTIVGNFPNPFSTSTTIAYSVNEAQQVTVAVWDLSGHQVAVLVDGVISEGDHEITFTAGDLPSGTYFVRLQTDETVSSRTLIVAR